MGILMWTMCMDNYGFSKNFPFYLMLFSHYSKMTLRHLCMSKKYARTKIYTQKANEIPSRFYACMHEMELNCLSIKISLLVNYNVQFVYTFLCAFSRISISIRNLMHFCTDYIHPKYVFFLAIWCQIPS